MRGCDCRITAAGEHSLGEGTRLGRITGGMGFLQEGR